MAAQDVTHRRVLAIAVPIVLSNASVPFLGLVDTGVVGQMGAPEPIGAVGIGAVILSAVYWLFGFLRMGVTGMAAQAHGASDRAEVAALLIRGVLIGVAGGAALVLLQPLIFAVGRIASPASAEVDALARTYMGIRIFSAPAAIALFAINGWLIALERSRAVLGLQLWMTGLNILLDLVFVLGFDAGVAGVAWATFLAEWSALALGLWLCRKAFAGQIWRNRALIFDSARWRQMVSVNSDILIRSVMLEIIVVSFLLTGARFGDVQLAANQILLQFLSFTAYALDGFAFAVESLVGQALGARRLSSLRRAVRLGAIWSAGVALVLAAGFALGGPWAISVMTTDPETRAATLLFLPYMVLAPLFGAPSWLLDGVFIGATQTRDMRNMSVISTVIYIAAVVPLVSLWGNHGLWMAMLVSYVARAATLGPCYPKIEARLR